ncbi:2-isopropylmalate synthase [Nocardia sp. CA2R105]|uniref:2-oxo-4-hydroxy-4-carboxy-5-ureidoimidazoline decarboxylase n=1 Tax=Nocardia coffeae TaxID=2873381 RepID=UPI001CA76139|nr:2-oxo-4-hydroxy-4-carboxy-5-ureidoimidazoline decarboxylase [Nocardia coffeae]MBY8855133.1 2-isopropylmalate synthase [Nocardia coffeae]
MLNPDRQAVVVGSHAVSPLDFDPGVLAEFNFPSPLGLIDSTIRKTYFTAGQTVGRAGFQRIAGALVELGIRDECLNVNWSGSAHPAPQDLDLLETLTECDLPLRLNVYADALLGDGRTPTPVPMREAVDTLVQAGARILAPGIVPAPDADAEMRQRDLLAEYFEYARALGLETTITLANVGRRDFAQLLRAADHAATLGATRIDLMDSTSSLSPEAMKVLVRRFRAGLSAPIPVTVHVHDEFGLATACAVAAATAGAGPDVAINGMSYRAGFAPLEEVVLALETLYGIDTGLRLDLIQPIAELVARESGVRIPELKPLTGRFAYLKHMPGDAARAMVEGQDSFPPISHGLVPARLGQRITWVWGALSSDAMVRNLHRVAVTAGHGLGSAPDRAEIAVLRRALDARVAAITGYPRWLDEQEATALYAALLTALRQPPAEGELAAALETALPHPDLIAAVRAEAKDRVGAMQTARTTILDWPAADLPALTAYFRPLGGDAEGPRATFSREEEAGLMRDAGTDRHALIVALTERYEQRLGHRYVVATTGSTAADILARLERRVTDSPERAHRTTVRECATIVEHRLLRLLTGKGVR